VNFFCKLLPPRPTFAQDMTPDEQALMQQHAMYWHEWIGKGHVVVFGFVADPAGAFGMGVVEFDGEAEVRAFTQDDPTIRAAAGFRFEVHPMPLGATTP
jgi:hypothetical protein